MDIVCVVYVIASVNGNILMQKRDNIEGILEPNKWCFPGGAIDHHESLSMAVIREIKEETGLIVNENELVFMFDDINTFRRKGRFFIIKLDGEPNIISGEGIMEWKSFEDIKRMDLAFGHSNLVNRI